MVILGNPALVLHSLGESCLRDLFKICFFLILSSFSAPEVMQARRSSHAYYGPKVDIWSLGAILYFMTYGRPPSYRRDAAEPPRGQARTRDAALHDVLRRTLVLDHHSRADIGTVLRHPYTNTP